MAVTQTNGTAVKVYNPQAMYITPFNGNVKGETSYQMEDVVRDSTTLTQDDAEENTVENEFGSSPIVNNIKPGNYTFTTSIGDMQPDLLEKIAGYTKDTTSGKVYAPSAYKEVFAEIILVFDTGGKKVACIMPKVQLNPKVTIESLNSSVGKIDINGIGYMLEITDGLKKYTTPFYVDPDWQGIEE